MSYLPKDHPFLQLTLKLVEYDHNTLEMRCILWAARILSQEAPYLIETSSSAEIAGKL